MSDPHTLDNFKLVLEPKLQNMISYKQKDKKKSKRWALYLKNWPSYGYFHESTQSKMVKGWYIGETGWDFIIWQCEEIEISLWVDSRKYP